MTALAVYLGELRKLRASPPIAPCETDGPPPPKPTKPALNAPDAPDIAPPKPTKPGFVSFDTAPEGCFRRPDVPSFADTESHLRRLALAAGIAWYRLRADPDGVRDADIEAIREHWHEYAGDSRLLRTYLAAVAYRLAIDPEWMMAGPQSHGAR